MFVRYGWHLYVKLGESPASAIVMVTSLIRTAFLMLLIGLAAPACDVAKQLDQLANLVRCQYRLANVSNIQVEGIAVNGSSGFSAFDLINLGSAYANNRLNLSLNLNMEVQNPQKDTAAFSQVAYQFALQNQPLTEGTTQQRFIVGPGATQTLPIPITVNLVSVLRGQQLTQILNLVSALAGQSADPTDVQLRVRPSLLVANQLVQFPRYFTVRTTFGGDSLR